MSSSNWIQLIKKISKEERLTSYPCTTLTGMVISTKPLSVEITQQMVVGECFIQVPDAYKDFEMEFDVEIQGVGTGKVKKVFENALKIGDKVILLRQDGGQLFTVIGRARNDS